ncbi:uncharacterized protein [Typha angustifolia]|uniref:uncharacterized protein n=1 Tax=Typha angustifolia TaxID=59011 RepID=UPI003C2C74CD
MKKWVEKNRRPRDFKKGDLVLVKLQPASLKFFRKVHKELARKYEGLFPVINKVGNVSYRVQLPAWLKIHPAFHVSFLKPYHVDREDPSCNVSSWPNPITTSLERQVDTILADRVRTLPNGAMEAEYFVKWKNLPMSEASWELEEALRHEEDKVQAYRKKKLVSTSI